MEMAIQLREFTFDLLAQQNLDDDDQKDEE